MTDLSRYVELYRQASELDTDVLWQKVNTIRDAIADGADVESLLTECGKESGDSAKQVRKFYAVARVFTVIDLAKDYDYWTHEVCATAPGVDLNDENTFPIAWDWLGKAVMGYTTERRSKSGKVSTIHRKHSARTLRAAIRAANADGKPKTVTVYKGQALITHVYPADFHGSVVWILLPNIEPEHIPTDTAIQVTITRETREPQAEAASEEPKRELIPLHTRGLAT